MMTSANTLLYRSQELGVSLWAEGSSIRYRGQRSAVESLLPEIKSHKSELLAILKPIESPKQSSTQGDESAPDPIDAENILEYAEERAAVLEFDAGMQRAEAEQRAVYRAVLKFRLIENQGGGTVIGAEGDTLQDLKDALSWRYGNRVEWTDK